MAISMEYLYGFSIMTISITLLSIYCMPFKAHLHPVSSMYLMKTKAFSQDKRNYHLIFIRSITYEFSNLEHKLMVGWDVIKRGVVQRTFF